MTLQETALNSNTELDINDYYWLFYYVYMYVSTYILYHYYFSSFRHKNVAENIRGNLEQKQRQAVRAARLKILKIKNCDTMISIFHPVQVSKLRKLAIEIYM